MKNSAPQKDPLDGKIVYLMIATVLVHFLVPLSISESLYAVIGYQIFYIGLFIVGIYLVSNHKLQRRLLIGATLVLIVTGGIFAYNPHIQWLNYIIHIIPILFLAAMAAILFRYIFISKAVTIDVLLAACTVYLLLGGIFATIFNFIEILTWFPEQTTHAFVDGLNNHENEIFPWQTIVYYSYATLTTLGYGDVLPVAPWARSMATLEAVVGVLYTAIIVARLVGLYAAEEIEEELEKM